MSELKYYGARAFTFAGALCALWSCAPELPVGRFACSSDADCPDGWSCGLNAQGAKRCFPEGSDYRAIRTQDGSLPDPNTTDGSEPLEGGSARDPDAGTAGKPPTGQTPSPPAAGSGSGTAPAAGSSGGTAGTPAAGSGGSQAGSGGTTPPPTQPNCTPDDADPALGVFVSPSGSESESCGTPAEPCTTLALAMARQSALARSVIYLDRGKYAESVSLRAGLAIRGAYERGASRWTRSCAADRATYSRIESTAEIGVLAEYSGAAELESLTISTLENVPMGHSTYGVFARGTSTELTLREVEVYAAPGGDGQTGNSGASPAARTGTCSPAADGANGARDGAPGEGAAAGMIDSSGYVPGDGTPGESGLPGHNGTLGSNTCRVCYESCDTTTCTGITAAGESCGVPGSGGCGGAAADGGAGGGGGGSSFGLFAWGARVKVIGGLLRSSKGGRGGSGGNPGTGGDGSDGGAGSNGPMCLVCLKSDGPITPPPATPDTEVQAAKKAADVAAPVRAADGGVVIPIACIESKTAGVGTAGGRGGKGSRGGVGGGGAGGSSYGVWTGGQAQLDVSPGTRIEIGEAGRSMSTGAKGESMTTKAQ